MARRALNPGGRPAASMLHPLKGFAAAGLALAPSLLIAPSVAGASGPPAGATGASSTTSTQPSPPQNGVPISGAPTTSSTAPATSSAPSVSSTAPATSSTTVPPTASAGAPVPGNAVPGGTVVGTRHHSRGTGPGATVLPVKVLAPAASHHKRSSASSQQAAGGGSTVPGAVGGVALSIVGQGQAPNGLPPNPLAAGSLAHIATLSPALTELALASLRTPLFLLGLYQAAGDEYGIPWQVLAAINEVETDYGFDDNTSSAGAVGWMQFMPATWAGYGVDATGSGLADPYNPADAIFAAAAYLRAAGGQTDIRAAILAYNHSSAYVDSVMLRAKLIESFPQSLLDDLTTLGIGTPPVPLTQAEQAALAVPPQAGAPSGQASAAAAVAATPAAAAVPPTPAAAAVAPTPAAAGSAATGAAGAAGSSATAARRTGRRLPGIALELPTRPGARVVAVRDGRVMKAGRSPRLGRFVMLRDAQGNIFTYAHLARAGTPPTPAGSAAARAAQSLTAPGATAAGASAASTSAATATASVATTAPAGGWPTSATPTPVVVAALKLLGYGAVTPRPPVHLLSAQPKPSLPAPHGWMPLHVGEVLLAGSVLGEVADHNGHGRLRFSMRTAGESQTVDPRPFLLAWELRKRVLRSDKPPAAAGPVSSPVASAASSSTTPATTQPNGTSTAGATPPVSASPTATATPTSAIVRNVHPLAGATDVRTWGNDRMFFERQSALSRQVSNDRRVHLSACGRLDVAQRRVDHRLLAVLELLADSGLHPTVAPAHCPQDGGAPAPGAVEALEISAINGHEIPNHRTVLTDLVLERLLALPVGFVPREIVSPVGDSEATNVVSDHGRLSGITIRFSSASGPKPLALAASDMSAFLDGLSPSQWRQLVRRLEAIGYPPLLAQDAQGPTPTTPPGL